MNQILFFTGIVLAGCFLLLSIFLFFNQKVPATIRYFLKMSNKKVTTKGSKQVIWTANKSAKGKNKSLKNKKTPQGKRDQAENFTEILGSAQNYATTLLDDSTTLLPDLNDKDDQ